MRPRRAHRLGILVIALLFTATPTLAKEARCVIIGGGFSYSGPCEFSLQRGGSFTLTAIEPRTTIDGLYFLNLHIVAPGKAKVGGLLAGTTDAGGGDIATYWGEYVRSNSDPACWVAVDSQICVY